MFFAEGEALKGVWALLLQLTIVFWPLAAHWASQSRQHSGVDRMLAEFSLAHQRDPYAHTPKKFRQAA
ncbi:MAG: hypothetical protein B7X08_01990 [Acidocella sp. 20-63-7]|nr:MAG: hypothetical protein B7X08_01990 [Acidocella sp. 20-63-7]